MVLFKRIKGFENYWVDFDGNVWSDITNKILKPKNTSNGYLFVSLKQNDKIIQKTIHNLVANTFLESNNKNSIIDHKDRNKQNNNVENLQFTTSQKNNHNRINNNEELNIYKMKNGRWIVKFGLKSYNVIKQFGLLEHAIEFRNSIQEVIHDDKKVCPIFCDLFQNEMKYIFKRKNVFELFINKSKLKYDKTFKTLEEAKIKRYELLKEFYRI